MMHSDKSRSILVVPRAKEDLAETLDIFEDLSLKTEGVCLFDVVFERAPDFFYNHKGDIDLFGCATSKNGVRVLKKWGFPSTFPLFVVGNASRHLASNLGFQNIFTSSDSTAQGLCKPIQQFVAQKRLQTGCGIYVHGDMVRFDLKHTVEKMGCVCVAYKGYKLVSNPKERDRLRTLLRNNPFGVLVLSMRVAKSIAELVVEQGITLEKTFFFSNSDACATPLKPLFRERVLCSTSPTLLSVKNLVKKTFGKYF